MNCLCKGLNPKAYLSQEWRLQVILLRSKVFHELRPRSVDNPNVCMTHACVSIFRRLKNVRSTIEAESNKKLLDRGFANPLMSTQLATLELIKLKALARI